MNILSKTLLQRSTRESLKYSSIDNLPILKWIEIHQTGDLTLLCSKKLKKYNLDFLMYVWEQIQNEYIKAFGISEEYQAHLQQQRKAALLACRYIIEGKRHFLTHARALRNSGNFKAASATVNIHKNMAMLTKAYGVILKADKVTVREYYNYINALNHGK